MYVWFRGEYTGNCVQIIGRMGGMAMACGKYLRPESRRSGRKRHRRRLAVWVWLVLGNGVLLGVQLLGYAHPVFTGLLMAALSARAGFRMGVEW